MPSHNKHKLLRFLARREWIRLGIRNRVIMKFCNPHKVASEEFVINFEGYRYAGNLNCYIDWNAFFYGAYEKNELLLLKGLLSEIENPVFIDIGANIGHHSLYMSRYCNKVHSFEPYQVVRKKLEDKISHNHIHNIVVHPIALGDSDTELEFFAPQGSNTGTGSFISSHEQENNDSIGRMRVVHADHYLEALNLEKVDMIKIDVEGFEKSVLTGLKSTIQKFSPVLFVEYSEDTKSSFTDFADFKSLLPPHYNFYKVVANRKRFGVFNQPKCILKNFEFEKAGGNLLLIPSRRTR